MMRNFEPGSSDVYLEVDSFYVDPQSGLQTRKEFKNYIDIVDATKAYYPYLNTDVLFKKFSLSSESILMLVGQPGVGKTKLVALYEKFMFENPDLFELNVDSVTSESYFKVAYIKNEDILASDSFWESINKLSYNLIFLDDADNCLLPRDSETMTHEDVNRKKFISQLLSFTDGINENSTKLIITTNRSVEDIDIAVLRRGRTFDILELQALSHDEAKEIWLSKNLTDEDFEELFKEKDVILPSELGAEIKLKIKMNEREEELGEYLLRDGISKIHSFRNKRRTIGI
jgi:SpoVK/Ycf46/Vps4 family AAA+-type ATPase